MAWLPQLLSIRKTEIQSRNITVSGTRERDYSPAARSGSSEEADGVKR